MHCTGRPNFALIWLLITILTALPFRISADATSTKVLSYSATTTDGGKLAPGLEVVKRIYGECVATWSVSASIDASRCGNEAGTQVFDPCFPGVESMTVLCPQGGPWATKLVMLRLRTLLMVDYRDGQRRPWERNTYWALELDGGLRCTATPNATSVLNGMRMTYTCVKSSGMANLYGQPDASSALWRVWVDKPGSTALNRIAVLKAWR